MAFVQDDLIVTSEVFGQTDQFWTHQRLFSYQMGICMMSLKFIDHVCDPILVAITG